MQGPRPFPARLEAVLFDIDGTLANTDPIHFETFVDLLREEGFNGGEPISFSFFQARISGGLNRLICQDLFPEWDDERATEFAQRKEAAFRERAAQKLRPLDGLERFMDWCDANKIQTAAVTNAPRANAELILDCIGRREWFDTIVIGDECEKGKPDPCPYLTAMKRLGVSAERCIAVEDSPSGARSAVAAGAFTIGVLTGQEPPALEEVGCSMLIKTFGDEALWQQLLLTKPEEKPLNDGVYSRVFKEGTLARESSATVGSFNGGELDLA